MFYKIRHLKAKEGRLKVYTLLEDGQIYLNVDKRTNPLFKGSKYNFLQEEGYWYYIPKTDKPAELRRLLNALKKVIVIENLEEMIIQAKNLGLRL